MQALSAPRPPPLDVRSVPAGVDKVGTTLGTDWGILLYSMCAWVGQPVDFVCSGVAGRPALSAKPQGSSGVAHRTWAPEGPAGARRGMFCGERLHLQFLCSRNSTCRGHFKSMAGVPWPKPCYAQLVGDSATLRPKKLWFSLERRYGLGVDRCLVPSGSAGPATPVAGVLGVWGVTPDERRVDHDAFRERGAAGKRHAFRKQHAFS